MRSSRSYEVILGGLLHDVGKVFQRACASEKILGEITRRMESTLCPVYQGRYSHRHVLFTNEFCDKYLDYLPAGLSKDSITNLASYHHRPDSPEHEIIQRADCLSSGMEREEDEEYAGGPSAFRRVRLRSIMGEIRIPGRDRSAGKVPWVHHLAKRDSEKVFPLPGDSPKLRTRFGEDLTVEYEALWQEFLPEWGKNRVGDRWGFVNRALSVLEHFVWCIPSATNVFPDISLFDHLKTTAAIAACLNEAPQAEEPFLLVAADFAGIQNYIYSIRSGAGGLARRLRARSFFVALMSDAVVHRILRAIDLPLTNCLMASGGKSYLLLPNNEETLLAVERVRREIDRWALKETRGEIRINMGIASLGAAGLKDFASSLERVNGALGEGKLRPMSECLQKGGKWVEFRELLAPLTIPENGGLCDSCQREGGPNRQVREKVVPVCDRCHEDQEMGRFLTRAKYVAFYDGEGGRFHLPLGTFDLADAAASIKGKPYLLLSLDGFTDAPPQVPLCSGFRARYVPRDANGDVKTFEEIAAAAKGRKGLAYLKSDVDNLGFIFAKGLKGEGEDSDRTSISRMTTLSRSLDFFFSRHFDELLARNFPEVYTVYSGGDDLLCLGPWDQVFNLALCIRDDFALYSCRNGAWSMSAAIATAGPRTPVLSAVSKAEELLEASKEIPGKGAVPWPSGQLFGEPHKDRITAFGTSVLWEEYPELLNRAAWLADLLRTGKMNTGKIRRLLRYSEMFRSFQRTGDTRYFRYVPLLAYDLRRNWSSGAIDEKMGEALDWAQRLLVPESPEMSQLRFVCEYALNIAREKEDENGKIR